MSQTYEVTFEASVIVLAEVEAPSLEDAYAFAKAVLDGMVLTTIEDDLRDAVQLDTLDITGVLSVDEKAVAP